MTTRNTLVLVASILSILCLTPVGCAAPESSSPVSGNGAVTQITILGTTPGSTSQMRADAIAEAIRQENPDWTVTSMAAGSPARVIAARVAGDADFFFTNGGRRLETLMQQPLHPDIDFESASEYRIVMPSSVMHTQFFARDSTGLNVPSDIVGRQYPFRLGTAAVSEQMFSRMLEYYGSSLDEARSWGATVESLSITSAEGVEALQSGRVDLGFTSSGIPNSFFAGLARGVSLLPIADPGLVSMFEDWGYMATTIPAGTYPFVAVDVPTVAALQSLSTRTDMPEDVVYGLLEAVFNHLDLIFAAQGEAANVLTPEYLAKAVPLAERNGEPYHPGALRFYREQGWVD
jgi:TRAP transporter TAXI family solute receptor